MSNTPNPIPDAFDRVKLILGEANSAKLASSFVLVAGCGAVGGHVIEALARTGVGRIKLVDFDVFDASNLNRQILATVDTIGQPKAQIAKVRILSINPACQVELCEQCLTKDNIADVLTDVPDLVVDAIDSVGAKTALLAHCVQNNIAVVSSMGAALRTDPAQVKTAKLEKTTVCPLARTIRKKLKDMRVPAKFMCVYSTEQAGETKTTAMGGENEKKGKGPNRVLGSLATLTGIFGLTLAQLAINELIAD